MRSSLPSPTVDCEKAEGAGVSVGTRFPIPPPITILTNLSPPLDLVLPEEANEDTDAGVFVFHSVGDSAYLGGPSGVCVKSKQSAILSAEPSRLLIRATPKFSSQNFTILTKEWRTLEM